MSEPDLSRPRFGEPRLPEPRPGQSLRVDPIACDGHGLCAELFPERIRLDEWGYPIVDPAPIPAVLAGHARRAAAACPLLALRLIAAAEAKEKPRLVGGGR